WSELYTGSFHRVFRVQASDTIRFVDTAQGSIPVPPGGKIADTITWTDKATVTRSIRVEASDTFTFSDVAKAVRTFHVSASDDFEWVDLAKSNQFLRVGVTDLIQWHDHADATKDPLGTRDLVTFHDRADGVLVLPDGEVLPPGEPPRGLRKVLYSPV